jgi:hypothetical protein
MKHYICKTFGLMVVILVKKSGDIFISCPSFILVIGYYIVVFLGENHHMGDKMILEL